MFCLPESLEGKSLWFKAVATSELFFRYLRGIEEDPEKRGNRWREREKKESKYRVKSLEGFFEKAQGDEKSQKKSEKSDCPRRIMRGWEIKM